MRFRNKAVVIIAIIIVVVVDVVSLNDFIQNGARDRRRFMTKIALWLYYGDISPTRILQLRARNAALHCAFIGRRLNLQQRAIARLFVLRRSASN